MNKQILASPGSCVFLAIIIVVLAVLPALAQNVPATAREAASLPQFAARLAHPSTASPHKPSPPAPARACSALPQAQRPHKLLPLDGVFYSNGPIDGICDIQGCTVDAYTINFGYTVTNSILAAGGVGGATFAFWLFPGDTVTSLDWSLGTQPFGSDLGYGTASGGNVTQQFISTNQFGYDIASITVTGLSGSVSNGNWLTLANAVVLNGDPVYWDENNGPSAAEESAMGTIPSESFNVSGGFEYPACFRAQPQDGFTIIHDFTGNEDGGSPSGVVIDKSGSLYGAAQSGGSGNGTVFKLFEAGSSWLLNPLYTFAGAAKGGTPGGVILGQNGTLYGAAQGGLQNCNGSYCGLIFDLRPLPTACRTTSCDWAEYPLYQFAGPTDASDGGALVADHVGNLYGVSASGGAQQNGAVFQLTPSIGGWNESILYSFTGGSDGAAPTDVIVGNDGTLYGAAALGGANGGGVVFQLSPSAGGWTETVLYDLPAMIEWGTTNPHSLLQDNAGNLFGEYQYFVQEYYDYNGIVFMLSSSNGKWVYTELRKGDQPRDLFLNLIMDPAGNLWGAGGGVYGCAGSYGHGYIFKLTRGSDGWQYSEPMVFQGNITFPADGALALDAQGNLYGSTNDCGKYKQGTVWQFSP